MTILDLRLERDAVRFAFDDGDFAAHQQLSDTEPPNRLALIEQWLERAQLPEYGEINAGNWIDFRRAANLVDKALDRYVTYAFAAIADARVPPTHALSSDEARQILIEQAAFSSRFFRRLPRFATRFVPRPLMPPAESNTMRVTCRDTFGDIRMELLRKVAAHWAHDPDEVLAQSSMRFLVKLMKDCRTPQDNGDGERVTAAIRQRDDDAPNTRKARAVLLMADELRYEGEVRDKNITSLMTGILRSADLSVIKVMAASLLPHVPEPV